MRQHRTVFDRLQNRELQQPSTAKAEGGLGSLPGEHLITASSVSVVRETVVVAEGLSPWCAPSQFLSPRAVPPTMLIRQYM